MALTSLALLCNLQASTIKTIFIPLGAILCLATIAAVLKRGILSAKSVTRGFLPYLQFLHATFLKPHTETFEHGQQSALESFYATQVRSYH